MHALLVVEKAQLTACVMQFIYHENFALHCKRGVCDRALLICKKGICFCGAEEPAAFMAMIRHTEMRKESRFKSKQHQARLLSHCVFLVGDFIKAVQVAEPKLQQLVHKLGRQI
jgi:hypothetical protein